MSCLATVGSVRRCVVPNSEPWLPADFERIRMIPWFPIPLYRVALLWLIVGWLAGLLPAGRPATVVAQEGAAQEGAAQEDAALGELAAGEPAKVMLQRDVMPLLKSHCRKCHGDETTKAGLDLRRRATMLRGGDSGPAIVPGNAGESLLMDMVEQGLMPPEGSPRLSTAQIQVLRKWLDQGAALERPEAPIETGSEDQRHIAAQDRQHWAFQPLKRPVVPSLAPAQAARTPIDAFLLKRLAAEGLTFNAEASRAVLLRRLSFDLWGLPPTPEQLESFLADDRPDAYERLVDRMLASSRYGERWARHWLDVAGYADSDGYLEADRGRPEAWRYRDYVIRAYNSDKPYSEFVREQLAGDELSDWRTADTLTPQMSDALVATGFLRTAADPTYGNYKEPLECHKVLADTMQILGSSFLGLTIQCARCHEHKAEPISQRDYYQLQAILLPAYDPNRWQVSAARVVPLASEPQQQRTEQHNHQVTARLADLQEQLARAFASYRDQYLDDQLAALETATRDLVKQALLTDPKKRSPDQQQLITDHAAELQVDEAKVAEQFAEFARQRAALQQEIAHTTSQKQSIVALRGLMDLEGAPPAAHVLIRGDHARPGAEVEPDVPDVLVAADFRFEPHSGYKTTGRRRALAEWLTTRDHPLTARVQVNRVWAHHFGRGLVASVDNLGRSGDRPAHPELLDWLAAEFADSGWSQKHLHRLIVTSQAYRQSDATDALRSSKDPDNVLLSRWRPRRHEGEVVRDSLLHLAGKLNLQMFGTPIGVSSKSDGEVVAADNPASNRRTIYLLVKRSQLPTLLGLFDVPRMEVNCPRRDRSIVVTQALTLLNSDFCQAQSVALSDRIWRQYPDSAELRLDQLFLRVLGRPPSKAERNWVQDFMVQFNATAAEDKPRENLVESGQPVSESDERAAWPYLVQVLVNSNEFLFVH
jgi:hypothetical protein